MRDDTATRAGGPPRAPIARVLDLLATERGTPGADRRVEPPDAEPYRRRPWRAAERIALGWLLVLLGAALAAPLLPLPAPDAIAAGPALAGPGPEHWLGTDVVGRDLLSRTVWGARVAGAVGLAAFAGAAVGGLVGAWAGFRGGVVDALVSWIVDVLLAFPAFLLALALVAAAGQGYQSLLPALGLLAVGPVARVARTHARSVREREFVQAARILGAREGRVFARDVLPAVVVPVTTAALLGVALAIGAEAALAFLDLSVPDPDASWGKMVAGGRDVLGEAPFVALAPAAVLFVTLAAVHVSAEGVRRRRGPV